MNKYLTILIFLSGLTAILVTIDFIDKKKKVQKESDQTIEAFYMNELMKASITNECIKLNNPHVYIGNNLENNIKLFDLVNEECLVFRFSGEACNVCVDFILEKIKSRFLDFKDNKRILLVGSNINDRVKESYYGKQILSYSSEDLGIPFEEFNIPFLFIIDNDRICKMIFVPEKALPELTDLYLDTILNRYFKND